MLWLAGGLVAAAVLCFPWIAAIWLIPVLLLGGAILGIMDLLQLRKSWEFLTVHRSLPNCVERDSIFSVNLQLNSSGTDPLSGCIRDVLPKEARPPWPPGETQAAWAPEPQKFKLPAGGGGSFGSEMRISTRGLYNFGPIWVRLTGKFGILEGQRCYDCPGQIKILPDSARSSDSLRLNARAESRLMGQLARSRLHGAGMEFESLSEFRMGDDPRRIDWRSSARHRHLVVRRYQLEQHRDVMMVLDCGRLMGTAVESGTKLDRAVDSALMLSRVALQKGDRCGVSFFDDQVLGYLPPLSGNNAHRAILESIYNVQSRWRESNFSVMFATLQARQIKRALIIVLSDIAGDATSVQFRTALAGLARRHLVVFAALQTPLLSEVLHSPVDSFLDISRKAVVLQLLQEREKALHSLSRSGVHVLDVRPVDLTVPLVNRYIDLRERNLL